MIEDILSKFKRALYKKTIGPLKYSKKDDYDASRYWHDRFSKYGLSLKGAGHEGLSEEDNKKLYQEASGIFMDLCKKEGLDFDNLRVLEVGCGNGFYTKLLYSLGVKKYVGIDITDVLFPELKRNFPKFKFIRKDITEDKIEGKFDLILMIDVIEHIVKEDKLTSALDNVKDCLSNNGLFVVSPVLERSKRHLFYVKWWSVDDIKQRFNGYIFRDLIPFRNDDLLIVEKNK